MIVSGERRAHMEEGRCSALQRLQRLPLPALPPRASPRALWLNINDAARISALISTAFTHLRGKSDPYFAVYGVVCIVIQCPFHAVEARVVFLRMLSRRSVVLNEEAKRVNERGPLVYVYWLFRSLKTNTPLGRVIQAITSKHLVVFSGCLVVNLRKLSLCLWGRKTDVLISMFIVKEDHFTEPIGWVFGR